MGLTHYKVTFECDCGEDYGSCEKRSFFILEYNRSVDIGTLFLKEHADKAESKLEKLGTFTDNGIAALIKVLTQTEPDQNLDDDDLKEIRQAQGYTS